MNWRAHLLPQVQTDFEAAYNAVRTAARLELEENGHLPPIGAVITTAGHQQLATLDWSGRRVPNLETMRHKLLELLRQQSAHYRVAGLARIVMWEAAGSTTLELHLDHRSGISRTFLTPYTLTETARLWGGPLREVTFGDLTVRHAEPLIW